MCFFVYFYILCEDNVGFNNEYLNFYYKISNNRKSI